MDVESIRSLRSDHSSHQLRPLPRPPTLGNQDSDVIPGDSSVAADNVLLTTQASKSPTVSHGHHRHRHRSKDKSSADGNREFPDATEVSRHATSRSNRSTMLVSCGGDSAEVRSLGRIDAHMGDTDDNWGETTTAVTGTTSEAGFSASIESMTRLNQQLEQSIGFACARYIGVVVVAVIGLVSLVSPVVMVVLPKTGLLDGITSTDCPPDCEGILISLSLKLIVLIIGSWALFLRRPRATLPRIPIFHAMAVLFIFVVTVAFWLFYGVRIISASGQRTYPQIVAFAGSMVDALLFVHYLAIILLELRQLQPYYVVKLVRSPDGVSESYAVGHLSVQHLALFCLDKYYCDFQAYNPYLERFSSRRMSRMTEFKVYSVDGAASDTTASSVHHSRSLAAAAASQLMTGSRLHRGGGAASSGGSAMDVGSLVSRGHNDRFYDELEYERKVRKRRARLIVAAEEAFTFVKRQQSDRGSAEALSPTKAAQNIFPRLLRPLQKYLRTTRQQPRYTTDGIVTHLAACIDHDLSAKAFIEPYLTQGKVIWNDKDYGSGVEPSETHTWTIVSAKGLSVSISDGTVVRMQRGHVTLLATVRRMPHFNLTEDAFSGKNSKFALQLSSETSV